MKLSARLNAGQKRRSMKSVTCPSRIRSSRFDALPPISSPSATGRIGCRAPERAKKTTIQATARAVRTVALGVEREVAGDDVLRHLVADQRRESDREQPGPLLRAGVERPPGSRHGRQR